MKRRGQFEATARHIAESDKRMAASIAGQCAAIRLQGLVMLMFCTVPLIGQGVPGDTRTRPASDLTVPATAYVSDAKYANLGEACAAAGSVTLTIGRLWTDSPSQTLRCAVRFLPAGKIQAAKGAVIAFAGAVVCPTYQQCFDTTTNAGSSVTFTMAPINLNPLQWGAVADGTGKGGTDQSAKFQAAATASRGDLLIPHAPLCYAVADEIVMHSNTVVYSDTRATCVQKLYGSHEHPVLDAGDGTAPVSNIWFRNFTVDGNNANIAGVALDRYNQGIAFAGASDSGTDNMTVENAFTGGISVACWGPRPMINAGDSVWIINTVVTRSGRNNIEMLCGTNTHIVGGEMSFAGEGDHVDSMSTGVDVEPFATGQFVTGFSMDHVEIDHNLSGGARLQAIWDPDAIFTVVDVNVHDNGGQGTGGLYAVNDAIADVPPFSTKSVLSITGGTFGNNTAAAGISFAGWNHVYISGEDIYGSSRGVLAAARNPDVVLGPGTVSGTLFDISADGPGSTVTLAGAKLVCSVHCIQPGEEASVIIPVTTFFSLMTHELFSPFGSSAGTAMAGVSGHNGLPASSSSLFAPGKLCILPTICYLVNVGR